MCEFVSLATQVKKAKDFFVPTSYIQGYVRGSRWVRQGRWLPRRKGSVCPRPRNSFFGSRVLGFWETRLVWIPAPTRLCLRGSHVQRKFRKRTTLRSESSTLIGLLYAGWRSRCEVFVARNAALSPWSKARARKLSYDKRQSTFFSRVGYPLWFLLGLYCVAWLTQESVSSRIFVRKKGMSHVPLNGRA
jgi:hypothetical protein